jgi:tetratricopeptide (TPR) repeat protein
LNNKGNALHELVRFTEAIESYDRILALQPANVPAFANRGAAFKDLRQVDEAIADSILKFI